MKVKLGDVCDKGSSNLKQSDVINQNGQYPVYGAAGLLGNIDSYHQDKPYVAVVKDGAGIGRVTLQPGYSSVIGTLQYLLPKENVLPEYLYYVTKHMHLEKYYTGATIPHIYFKDYKNEKFNLDAIEKQQRIVDILKKIENIIESRQQELQKLDDLIRARFVEMFGEDIKQSNMTIADIAEETTVGIANSATHAYSESGVVMLRNQNIRVNYLDDRDLIYIKQDFAEKYKNKALHEGDILVTRTGANVGMACIVPKKYEGCQTFTTLILRLRKDISISPIFVCHYINSPLGKSFVDENKIGGGQPNFGAKQLSIMPIVVPSEEKQIAFDLFVNQVDKSKLLSGCRLFHSWAPENRDKPKHVGVPRRETKDLRGGRRQQ